MANFQRTIIKTVKTLGDVKKILKRHEDRFVVAYIFGSCIRDDQDEYSDVDIILVRNTELPYFDRLREIFDLFHDLGRADLLIYTEKEFHTMIEEPGRYFFKDAVAQGVKIEGKQGRVTSLA